MFYSHEILTNRQHGVATIWLVATLGAKSSLKKVTRKAILDVNVPKACDTIIEPSAPMALRLQGNLLYGVSRVYSQQSGYLLSDTHNLRDQVRGAIVLMKETELDPGAGRARPDQLNLPDDPAFEPDLDINLDMAMFDLPTISSRSLSLLSPHAVPSARSSLPQHGEDDPQLLFPSADSSVTNNVWDFGAGSSSAVRTGSRAGHAVPIFEESALIENPDLEIDIDGNLVEVPAGVEPALHGDTLRSPGAPGTGVRSETGVTDRARAEHEAGTHRLDTGSALAFDDAPMLFGEDEPALPAAQPFPPQRAAAVATQSEPHGSSSVRPAEESSSSVVVVEAAQRRARQPKALRADERTELTNRELNVWNANYLANMLEAVQIKQKHKSLAQAKKNAAFWVLYQGIAGVGQQFAGDSTPHPLSVFSGQALLDALLRGGTLSPARSKRSRGSSGEEQEVDEEEETRRVRARIDDEEQLARGGDVGILGDDDGIILPGDDIEIEMGRNAPPSLPDHSSQMPWNISVSRHGSSARPFGAGHPLRISSSVGPLLAGGGSQLGPPSALSRQASRLMSSSPLLGRGQQQQRYSSLELPGQPTGGDAHATGGDTGFGDDFAMSGTQDFALYAPLAAADGGEAAAAAQNQWIAAILDEEAHNFLAFLDAQINARADQEQEEEESDQRGGGKIKFEALLPPAENTKVVGAQALLHVLTLATKGLIELRQEDAFGDIEMSVVVGLTGDEGGEEEEI